jgi:hypothetical protein
VVASAQGSGGRDGKLYSPLIVAAKMAAADNNTTWRIILAEEVLSLARLVRDVFGTPVCFYIANPPIPRFPNSGAFRRHGWV